MRTRRTRKQPVISEDVKDAFLDLVDAMHDEAEVEKPDGELDDSKMTSLVALAKFDKGMVGLANGDAEEMCKMMVAFLRQDEKLRMMFTHFMMLDALDNVAGNMDRVKKALENE